MVCTHCTVCHRAPMEGLLCFVGLPYFGCVCLFAAQHRIFSGRCAVLVLHRCLVAERCQSWCHKRDRISRGTNRSGAGEEIHARASMPTTIAPKPMLRYITTFVGGGGPRFWFSASPQTQQLNYAQVLIEVTDKEITPEFIKELQPVLTASIPGARMDARQLLTNPIDYPIEIRVSSTADVNAAPRGDRHSAVARHFRTRWKIFCEPRQSLSERATSGAKRTRKSLLPSILIVPIWQESPTWMLPIHRLQESAAPR